MGIIATKLKGIIKFDINLATQEAVSRDKQKIINMNKQQLNDGLRSDGSEMPKYSRGSLVIKQLNGIRVPRNNSFSLKNKTGALQAGMFIKPERTFFEISSSDPKLNEKLTDQAPGKVLDNKDAFGLTPNNKEILIELILIPFYQLKLKG